jgi:hypothetical protein
MNRRELLQLTSAAALTSFAPAIAEVATPSTHPATPEYDAFELVLDGPSTGNPFMETSLSATFTLDHRAVTVEGFYDGGSTYRIRFMPDTQGQWSYTTTSNVPALNSKTGSFTCTTPRAEEHGPVYVSRTHHFAHADGTPFFPFGTTCYAWVHQGAPYEQQTLDTLAKGPFNKIRMCVFPKSYEYNHNEPEFYPFPRPAGTPLSSPGDTTRFDPAFFHHLERRIADLRALNVQADLILFHPYDRWGYASLDAETNARYLRYLVARLAAYSNVWWSLANEFDLVRSKTTADFTNLLHIVQRYDPYQHMRSIHYSHTMYDYASPAVTHASLQTYDFAQAPAWLAAWNKPICYDEMQYEGDLPSRWGNLSGQEMTRRFWLAIINGCYPTHGETFLTHPDAAQTDNEKIWWSHGGKLSGSSPARIAFLRKLLESMNTSGLDASPNPYYLNAQGQATNEPRGSQPATILYYMDQHQPVQYIFPLPEGASFTAELIDPWEMTITHVEGIHTGKTKLILPIKTAQAVRFTRVKAAEPTKG